MTAALPADRDRGRSRARRGGTLVGWEYRCAAGYNGDVVLAHLRVPDASDDAGLTAHFPTRFHRQAGATPTPEPT